MEENEDKKKKNGERSSKGSNSCVIDLPIDDENIAEEKETDNIASLNKSFDDILNFTKKLTLKDNFENILDIGEEHLIGGEEYDIIQKTRSKTFIIKISNKNSPKPKPIENNEYIKPLRLNSKKSILSDSSQKEIIDCKSCDDKSDNEKRYLNYFSNKDEDTDEEIKNTLKINKIKNENKKSLFHCKVYCKYYNEFENILNIEKIFLKKINDINNEDVLIEKNKNMQNSKKRLFWHKHINVYKKQLCMVKRSEKKNNINEFRKRSDSFSKKNNYEELFILGVLESAAKDKKRRKTIHSHKLNKHYKYVEDEK